MKETSIRTSLIKVRKFYVLNNFIILLGIEFLSSTIFKYQIEMRKWLECKRSQGDGRKPNDYELNNKYKQKEELPNSEG